MALKPGEEWARRDDKYVSVAGVWVGGDQTELRLRPANFSKEKEIVFEKHADAVLTPDSLEVERSFTGDSLGGGNYSLPGSFSGSYTYEETLWSSDDILLRFPLGGEKCLIVYAETGYTLNANGSESWESSWEQIQSNPDEWGQYNCAYKYELSINTTGSFGALFTYKKVKAWVVSWSNIKEVYVPEALEDYILQFVQRYDTATLSVQGTVYSYSDIITPPGDQSAGIDCVNSFNASAAGLLPYWATGSMDPIVGGYTLVSFKSYSRTVVPTPSETPQSFLVSGQEIESTVTSFADVDWQYGIKDYYGSGRDEIIKLGVYDNSNLVSPGSIYILKNPDSLTNSGDAPRAVAENFFPLLEPEIPNISLGLEYGDNFIGDTVRMKYQIIDYLLYPYFLSSLGLQTPEPRGNFKAIFRYPYNDPDLEEYGFQFLAAWDWQLPAYCNQQFIDMGFFSEDFVFY